VIIWPSTSFFDLQIDQLGREDLKEKGLD